VKVYAGTDPETSAPPTRWIGKSTGSVHVTGLEPAPRWYFELVPAKGGSLVTADHSLHFESVPNLRDIGGYRTSDGKWVKVGQLYRPTASTVVDADNATLQALGIKLVCDLRDRHRAFVEADKEIPGSTNEAINIIGEDPLVAQLTRPSRGATRPRRRTARERQGREASGRRRSQPVSGTIPLAQYKVFFSRIEDPNNLPTVMHCSAGKDRTGWASAAILTALGVPKSTVMQDYLVSNDYLKAKNDKTLSQTAALIDRSLIEPVLTVRKEYLDASFSEVKAKYKTFDKYLAAVGVTKAASRSSRTSS